MGARWYDPALARWLSADARVPEPGNPQALNRYAYVLGNPLLFIDPSGHSRCATEPAQSVRTTRNHRPRHHCRPHHHYHYPLVPQSLLRKSSLIQETNGCPWREDPR